MIVIFLKTQTHLRKVSSSSPLGKEVLMIAFDLTTHLLNIYHPQNPHSNSQIYKLIFLKPKPTIERSRTAALWERSLDDSFWEPIRHDGPSETQKKTSSRSKPYLTRYCSLLPKTVPKKYFLCKRTDFAIFSETKIASAIHESKASYFLSARSTRP